jgi:dinuclear metal center YbgI/SA1388 family protein
LNLEAIMTGASLISVHNYLDDLLEPTRFNDYCPNGLQVEGRCTVARLVSGVSACQALIDEAIELRADAILVHHGYFWRGEDPCVVGLKRTRLAALLHHNISLLAYHLPLDAHPEYGNNARLGALLGLRTAGLLATQSDVPGLHGVLPAPLSGAEFADKLTCVLGRRPLHVAADRAISRVAWCTGAAQGFIEQAVALGVDAYVTGEVSEPTVHIARESGIHFFAAGHHATERYGVRALGEHLAQVMAIEHCHIDIDNPA